MTNQDKGHHIVIVGGGFGGLNAAKELKKHSSVRVTLLDKRNFHLFQPLLYQVAAGGLSPGDIAYPLRAALADAPNVEVLAAKMVDIRPNKRRIILHDDEHELAYDSLIVATGAAHHYFGHTEWATAMPGLKTVEEALHIRSKILFAFETAERETDPEKQRAWLNFVVVGGGATGVELAGAIAGLAHETLVGEFRHFDPQKAQVILLEATDRILNTFPEKLSAKAEKALISKGVEVRTNTFLTDIAEDQILLYNKKDGGEARLKAHTILWAAGIKASPIGQALAKRTGAKLDRIGRVIVEPDLSVPGYPNIFVIGDLAHFAHQTGYPLPGVAQVAMQQGKYAARTILAHLKGKDLGSFLYRDKGTMAVIGRNAAVAHLGSLQLNGVSAWLIWLFVHINFLIGFDNKLLVLIQWAWSYFTRKQGARLITGQEAYPTT